METGEVIYERVYASPRPPPKISLKHDWMKELGSEVAQRQDGQVVQQSKSSSLNQLNPNPVHDRTGQPVIGGDPRTAQGGRKTSRSQEIVTRSFHEEADKHDRTGQPVVIEEKVYKSPRQPPKISLKHDWIKELGSEVARQAEGSRPTQPNPNPNHDRTVRPVVIGQPIGSSTTFNEVDIDFRVSGLPHSVVKQAENSRVRELVKKIENHPHRQDLQADLQQNNAYNPFSEKSKKMIKDMGNVELF